MEGLAVYAQQAEKIAIAGHVRPDGDCVGSCLGAYNYLHKLFPEKVIHVYLEPIPDKFSFLANSDVIINPADCLSVEVYDLFIALDCGDLNRLGKSGKIFKAAAKTICVDHHISNQQFAGENYVVPDASSASELVYGLMDPDQIDKQIAECLYLGIVHDTGVFQYSCTSSKTMAIAGKLMDFGIDYPRIVDETFFVKTYTQQRIAGKAMQKSKLCLDGKCIYSILKLKHLQKFQATGQDLEGIVSGLRSTDGVEVSIFLYELENRGYKISMRSAAYVDVAKIMEQFGGGGHCRAAGGMKHGDPKQIVAQIIEMVKEQI